MSWWAPLARLSSAELPRIGLCCRLEEPCELIGHGFWREQQREVGGTRDLDHAEVSHVFGEAERTVNAPGTAARPAQEEDGRRDPCESRWVDRAGSVIAGGMQNSFFNVSP